MGQHWTAGDIEQSYPFHRNSLNSVYNNHVTRCFCFRLLTEAFCSQPQNLWNTPTTFDLLFLPKQQFSNEKIWCLETKIWSKVIFSQHVQRYAETSVWFVHVTDCYYFGKRNSNKFFLTIYKISFCSKLPHIDGGDFEQVWWSLFDGNACAMNWLFLHLEKTGCSGLSL